MSVEEPGFRVRLRDGPFEVRDYPSLVIAEVAVSGDQKQAANTGFRILAGYIFGRNARRENIRFSGLTEPEAVRAKADELKAWLEARGLHTAGAASLAQYDPRWTL